MSHKWNHNFPKIAREAGFIIRELSIGHCIDWRFIASVDPYAIVGEKDYEKLDEFIPHISEVPIGTVLNNRILDPAIGKYFVLAQFSIQYLLFCKQFLDETVVEIRNTAQDVQKENSRLEKICRKKNEEIVSLHRKLQRSENVQAAQQVVYPCTKCTKNFISLELLNAHMARKHAELTVVTGGESKACGRKLSDTDSNLINTIKLELEVKQLKERLNVAEKDLVDQRNREHRCHVCSDSQSREKEKQDKAKAVVECRNVGIQNNLEDIKDVNEKEVQTSIRSKSETPPRLSPIPRFSPSPSPTRRQLPPMQQQPSPPPPPLPLDYISKSELDAIVREQNEQFESWKRAERDKFNSEIENVRQNLTEAIQELEKRDRVVSAQQPSVVPMVVVEQPPEPAPARREEDDSIWKLRYYELEQMYENSQRQVREMVENVESAYESKFKQIERMMESRQEVVGGGNLVPKIVAPRSEEKPFVPAIVHHEESEDDEVITQEETNSADDEQQSESDEEIRALEAAKAKLLARASVTSPVEEPREISKAPEKPLISPKKQILNTFKHRLKLLGIDSKTKTLSKEDLNSAAEALAERRDASKKKNRSFFITRNQLLAKVDKIARSKTGETLSKRRPEEQPIIKKREPQAVVANPTPKVRSTFQIAEKNSGMDILPSKLKLSSNERVADFKQVSAATNVFKAKFSSSTLTVPEVKLSSEDIITVQAEINPLARSPNQSPKPAAMSDYDRHLERLLDTPVKRLSAAGPDVITVESRNRYGTGDHDSDLSEILEASPLQPKPIPKKRVLFNLDRDNGGTESDLDRAKQIGPTLSSTIIQVSKADEDSDWNISSFDDEK